jgi:hypothetical protein
MWCYFLLEKPKSGDMKIEIGNQVFTDQEFIININHYNSGICKSKLLTLAFYCWFM